MLTYPLTSNSGERSFSRLKYILTDQRCTMTQDRLCHLALMAIYPERLSALTNKVVIARAKNRRAIKRHAKIVMKAVIVYCLEIFVSLILSLYFQNFRRKLNSLHFIVCPSVQLFAYPSDVTVGFSYLNNFRRFFLSSFLCLNIST